MENYMLENYYTYKAKMLDLFLKTMGEGFPKIIFKYNENLKPNNLKQKVRSMNNGDMNSYSEIDNAITNCINAFIEGEVSDKSMMFSEKNASNKYWTSFNELYKYFSDFNFNDNFFYESFDDTFSYLIAKNFYTEISCENYNNEKSKRTEENQMISSTKDEFMSEEEWKEYHEWQIRCFRPEYSYSISDVRFNKKNNKTFFTWVIKEFKKALSSDKVYENILEIVFRGEPGVSTSFEKLLKKPGNRKWSTFEKLFSNEQNDKNLWEILNKDSKYLAAYQIFQSRMFVAYCLENFCASLPKFINEENTKELIKIITCDVSRKKPEDFLIPNHNEKTKAMLETFKAAWESPLNSEKDILSILQNFDKDCPATETFKAYFSIYHKSLRRNLTENQIHEAFDLCMENSIYFEGIEMHNYLRSIKQGNIYE